MIISKKMKLAELIHHDYMLISTISRFGINFGIADKTIEKICIENDININFFLEILNTLHDSDYTSKNELQNFPFKLIIDYLLKSHNFYNDTKIPYIERLINKLSWKNTDDDKNKTILKKFFNQYKKEVAEHTKNEEANIYPYILKVEEAYRSKNISAKLKKEIKQKPIKKYEEEHEGLDLALLDLKNIIIKYLPPSDTPFVINRILDELFKLEKDLNNHTNIENKVLVPQIIKMEKEIISEK